eukprot:m.265154 g.265154  ORF g.265154 m.265154 type:complete len:125 (+) comp40483_c0_seq1:7302-7676(+)
MLWAEMIDVETHDSYDVPPNVPMFDGPQSKKKFSLASAVSELGSTIATAMSSRTESSVQASANVTCNDANIATAPIMTPKGKARAQRNFVHQLQDFHSLLEIGAIEQEDYEIQKRKILGELNNF